MRSDVRSPVERGISEREAMRDSWRALYMVLDDASAQAFSASIGTVPAGSDLIGGLRLNLDAAAGMLRALAMKLGADDVG